MVIQAPTVLTAGGSGTDGLEYTTAVVGPDAGSLIAVFVEAGALASGENDIPTISDTIGLTWTQVDTEVGYTGLWMRGTWFVAEADTSDTGTIKFTFAHTQSNCHWHVIQIKGANNTDPVVQVISTAFNTTVNPSVTLPAPPDPTSLVLGAVMPCTMGADLSQGDDFCAFTFLFPLANGSFAIKTRSYITQLTLDNLPGAMWQKYQEFIQEGSLIIMDATVLDMLDVFDDLDAFIVKMDYDVRAMGFDPYNAKEFVNRWEQENGPYNIEKVQQGARTESVPLGELKKLSENHMLLFDEVLLTFCMGNAITIEDTNGNRKLLKRRHEEKVDNVAALMDAWIVFKLHKEEFE